MKNNLIEKMLVKSMIRELENDVKVDKFTIENKKHFTSKKARKLSSKQLINLSNIIVSKAFKNELKFISLNLHKTYLKEPSNYEKIKKLENNVNITLDLMQKEKIEIEQYKLENNTQTRNNLNKAYNKYMYKNSKELFKHTKRGYEIVDNIETSDLKNTCIVMLLEYSRKYNNEIINNKGFIPYYLYNKLTYKVQYLIQKIKHYDALKVFTNDAKTYYLIEQKSFEIFQRPIHIEQKEQAKKQEQRKQAIKYIFSKLTLEQFKIYKLKMDNYSFQDIALKLDKTRGTISKIYYRVLGYMQKDTKLAEIMQSL